MTQAEPLAAASEAVLEASAELSFWSVTTLIKAALGTSEGIVQWCMSKVAERAYDRPKTLASFVEEGDRDGAIAWLKEARWEKLGKAAERGTAVHERLEGYALGKLIEQHLAGEQPELPDQLLPYDEQLRRFLNEWRPRFLMAEAPVYHVAGRYAGTLDAIVEIGGDAYVVDAKTTEKLPAARSRPPYSEIALQLVAYRRAEVVGVSPAVQRESNRRRYYVYDPALAYEPMPATRGALALVVSPVDYRLIPVRTDEEVWRYWKKAVEVARWQLEISKRVFGPELSVATPPRDSSHGNPSYAQVEALLGES